MFLLLNAFIASLDGILIGTSLKLSKIKLTKINFLLFFIGNILIYFLSLYIYYYFKLTFMNKIISTIFYLLLGFNSLKENNHKKYYKLSLIDYLLITITHSLDGTLISLNFVYNYSLIYITIIFSIFSISLLYIGYKIFKLKFKNSNIISFILFLLLAILNYFL